MKIAIDVKNLSKHYGNHKVLDKVSFQVYKGEIFSLLGINGAGKTTTLECIEKLRDYVGEIEVNGKIGIQLQSSTLTAHIKTIEALKLLEIWNHEKLDKDMIERLGILEFKNKEYEQLSTGQKRRLHLCLAMIGDPDIIVLDEPTAGLDVEGRIALHNEMRRLKKSGKTMIVSSHDMAEVETLCDRIAILKDGKIGFVGSPHELTTRIQDRYHIHVTFSQTIDLSRSDGYVLKDNEYVFETDTITPTLEQIAHISRAQEKSILDIQVKCASLEQRFMDIVKEEEKHESFSL